MVGGMNAGGRGPAPLRLLHDEQMPRASVSFAYWERQDTTVVVASLSPGLIDSLKVKPDGLVMDGNTRILVLRQRGYDVDMLPREPE